MYGFKILCEISKVPFEISHKIWTHTLLNVYNMGVLKIWQIMIC